MRTKRASHANVWDRRQGYPLELGTWEGNARERLRIDPIWRTKAYRLSVLLTEHLLSDSEAIRIYVAGQAIVPQLHLAVASIGANIAEGYRRTSGRDRARFFQYALGSAREARHWYYALRGGLDLSVVNELSTCSTRSFASW